jgi:hypothetical protein
MKYLDTLLKQISSEHPQPVVEETVHMDRVPMAMIVEIQELSNPKDPKRQKVIVNARWASRMNATINLSTVKNQTIKFKDIQELAY